MTPSSSKPVERLFPFALRSRILVVGRQALWSSRKHLQFILITHDLSTQSRRKVLQDYPHHPIIEHYRSEDLLHHFGLQGTKILGFKKSALAQSLLRELHAHQLPLVAELKPAARSSWQKKASVNSPENSTSGPDYSTFVKR